MQFMVDSHLLCYVFSIHYAGALVCLLHFSIAFAPAFCFYKLSCHCRFGLHGVATVAFETVINNLLVRDGLFYSLLAFHFMLYFRQMGLSKLGWVENMDK